MFVLFFHLSVMNTEKRKRKNKNLYMRISFYQNTSKYIITFLWCAHRVELRLLILSIDHFNLQFFKVGSI